VSAAQTWTVGPEEADQRLDRWFKRHFPELGHGRLEKLLRTGQVRVDGRRAKAGTRLESGQAVRVPPLAAQAAARSSPKPAGRPAVALSPAEEAALRASVLHRDNWVIALDKPPGLAVQGGSGQTRHLDAMLDALRFGAEERPRLVHRLDRDTSGVLLMARTAEAARRLGKTFKSDAPRKLYWALVAGVPAKPRGRIDLPLGKQGGAARERMSPDAPGAKRAETRYALVAAKGKAASWLCLRPMTGRTHQLRAHMAAVGHPILGDGKYGGKTAFPSIDGAPKRLMLLAREIALPHPDDGTTLRVQAPPPPAMAEAFAALGFDPELAAAGEAAAWLEA
jgi:23S rRNA pseudouridine955/2504/2580 synthase